MGTITITTAGFSGGRPNGSRSGTLSDTDYDRLIAWARARTLDPATLTGSPPTDPRTAGQVLLDFVQAEWKAWRDAITVHERPVNPVQPAPINITG